MTKKKLPPPRAPLLTAEDRVGAVHIVTGAEVFQGRREWYTTVERGGSFDGTVHYATEAEAIIGHRAIVAKIRETVEPSS